MAFSEEIFLPRGRTMILHRLFYRAACVLAVVVLVSGWKPAKDPTFTSIDFAGATFTNAAGINPRGDIVGGYTLAGITHGYLLSGGEFTSIDFPGATFTTALGINPRGDIVGRYNTDGGVAHGYLLSGGEFTSIDFPGANSTQANKINPQGDIVGWYDNSTHGYLRSGGEFTSIDFPGATQTAARDINPRGDIVGDYRLAGIGHGFLLSQKERDEDRDEGENIE